MTADQALLIQSSWIGPVHAEPQDVIMTVMANAGRPAPAPIDLMAEVLAEKGVGREAREHVRLSRRLGAWVV